jgi:hypothetical protein
VAALLSTTGLSRAEGVCVQKSSRLIPVGRFRLSGVSFIHFMEVDMSTSTSSLAAEVSGKLGAGVELNSADFAVEALPEMPIALRQMEASRPA